MSPVDLPISAIIYGFTQSAVAVMAAAAVLEAGKRPFDLFGMMVIAMAAALGGGTLRDLLLDRTVFWVADQTYLFVALGAGLLTFFLARRIDLPSRLFLIPDALGLALFTVAGCKVALLLEAPWLVASFMGVITGVMGGVLRDVLCNEEPLVFQGPLYATAAWCGALLLIGLLKLQVDATLAALIAGSTIFLLRMAALYWDLGLPKYQRSSGTD
ncbi:MAG: trimeric intracellular cation channel family protein [Candidatus Thiodiazotropha sp.]|jgi:uncharacterized membrane protein YeiH